MNEVNFCELPNDKLMLLIDFIGETEIIENSECVEKFINGKCVEKRWSYYSELIVTTKQINAIYYTSVTLMTEEKYIKMSKIFE